MKKAIAIILIFAVSISLFGCKNHDDDTEKVYTNTTTIEQMISEWFKCYFLYLIEIQGEIDLDEYDDEIGESLDDCQIEKDENGVEFKRTYTLNEDEDLIFELVKRKNAMKISCDRGEIKCEYSENGGLIFCTTSSGFTYEFSYYDNGKFKGITVTSEEEGYVTEKFYGAAGPFASRTYNANGEVTEIIKYGNDGSIERTKYLSDQYYIEEYDCDGNLIKTASYADDGSITKWEEFEYDEDRNKTKWLAFAADGSITEWKEYEYDEEGNEIKCSEYTSDGSLTGWEEYEYDGVIQKTTVYDSDGSIIDEYDDKFMVEIVSALTFGIISPATMEALDNVDLLPDGSESSIALYLLVCGMLAGV